jgi:hypothetical protein
MDMTKFEDVDDPGFLAVAGELRRWCRELSSSSLGASRVSATGHHAQPGDQGGPQCRYMTLGRGSSSDYRIVVVPYASNADFVGRSSIMEKLKEMLSPNHGRPKTTHQVRVALHGLGGIGYVLRSP